MRDWNVVISVHEQGFTRARHLLAQFGDPQKTGYYNVLVMKVADPAAMLDRLRQLQANAPEAVAVLSRVMPAAHAFDFQTAEEFEAKAREIALSWLPALANKSFHVRIHRRGFKGRLSTPDEERFLDEALLAGLAAQGTPGRIAFDDPDAVIDVETVDNRAGMSLWSREDLARCSFLKVD